VEGPTLSDLVRVQKELDLLRRQLEAAIRQEAYEQAARLRDRIRQLEQQGPACGE